MDAIEVLIAEHRHVEQLFREFSEDHDMSLATEICLALTQHARAEEQHIYPVLAMHDEGLAQASSLDHAAIKDFVARIQAGAGGTETVSYMGQLREEMAKHVESEEEQVFPLLRAALQPAQLASIGAEMESDRASAI